jgi:S-DNA-T family DNA segregation ATPase FtsK/SpoIIIE
VELAELAENLAPYEKNPTSSWRVHQYADHKLKAMTEVIDNAYTVMETRFDIMRKKRIRKMYPTPENPLYVIAIDELLRMLPQISKETYEKLKELTFLGRKACIVVWALTQLSQQEVLGLWRNLVPTAICLRSFNAATTNAILGSDAESSGARCSKISVHTPGVGFMARNGVPGYTKFRTCWVDDRAMRMIARGELPKELRDKKIPNEHLAVDLSKWRKKVAA